MANKKIDLNKPLLGLDGTEIPDETIGKNVARALVSTGKGDAIKCFTWASSLFKGETISLDESDISSLKQMIKDSEVITNLVKGQALLIIEKAK